MEEKLKIIKISLHVQNKNMCIKNFYHNYIMSGTFIIKPPKMKEDSIIYPIHFCDNEYEIYVKYTNLPEGVSISDKSEGIVAMFFIICLYNNEVRNMNLRLKVHAKTDISLIERLNKLHGYFPNANKNFLNDNCEFLNITKTTDKIEKRKSIITSTGGVDSTCSIIKHKEEIGACLFVLGFDISMRPNKTNKFWTDWVLNNTRDVMNKCLSNKIPLIVAKTNLWDKLIYEIQKNMTLTVVSLVMVKEQVYLL